MFTLTPPSLLAGCALVAVVGLLLWLASRAGARPLDTWMERRYQRLAQADRDALARLVALDATRRRVAAQRAKDSYNRLEQYFGYAPAPGVSTYSYAPLAPLQPQGPQGPQEPQGPQGPQGPQAAVGMPPAARMPEWMEPVYRQALLEQDWAERDTLLSMPAVTSDSTTPLLPVEELPTEWPLPELPPLPAVTTSSVPAAGAPWTAFDLDWYITWRPPVTPNRDLATYVAALVWQAQVRAIRAANGVPAREVGVAGVWVAETLAGDLAGALREQGYAADTATQLDRPGEVLVRCWSPLGAAPQDGPHGPHGPVQGESEATDGQP